MESKWLETLCDKDGRREFVAHPWRHPQGGVVATDGRVLVWLRTAEGAYHLLDGVNLYKVSSLLNAGRSAVAGWIGVDALRDWCGGYEAETQKPCLHCGGKGTVYCDCCERDGAECGECRNGTATDYPKARLGRLAGVLVDRNRLAGVLQHLDGVCCVSSLPVDKGGMALRLDVTGVWTLLLMAMASHCDDGIEEVKPSPELAGAF